MITYSVIQKSQLEGTNRLDAEYYQPEYLGILSDLSRNETVNLETLASKITQGPNPVFESNGKRCLNGRNVKSYRVDPEDSNYVSEAEFEKLKNFKVKENDILITLKGLGSIGKTGFVFGGVDCIFSRDIGLIRCRSDQWAKYIYAFLMSKYGSGQIERATTGGTGQLTLATRYLKLIRIPQPTLVQVALVSNIIKWSDDEHKKSSQLYSQAESLLLEELELKDFQIPGELSYTVNYSDTEKVGRIDADYFQPKYNELVSRIKNQNAKSLLEIVQDVPARFAPKRDESYRYVELADINSSIGIIDGFSEVLGKEAPSRARRLLKPGDIIVSSIQGSLEKVALVEEGQDGNLASTGFFQFRSNKVLPEVLLILARSVILQWQFERECAGTILSAVPQESLKRLIIPILPTETQQKIADLVRQSHEARKKSKELLEEAKRKVEEMIEEGGT